MDNLIPQTENPDVLLFCRRHRRLIPDIVFDVMFLKGLPRKRFPVEGVRKEVEIFIKPRGQPPTSMEVTTLGITFLEERSGRKRQGPNSCAGLHCSSQSSDILNICNFQAFWNVHLSDTVQLPVYIVRFVILRQIWNFINFSSINYFWSATTTIALKPDTSLDLIILNVSQRTLTIEWQND